MTRTIPVAVLALFLCASARADVTIRTAGTGKGLGMSGETTSTTYIKGLKMRVETRLGKKDSAMIFDVDNQKLYILDAKKKKADAWDMAAFSQELASSISIDGIRSSIKPNGQVKSVNGQDTEGYDVEIIVPATVGGAGGMAMTIVQTGTTWIAKGVPGAADYAAFYQGAAEKGWIFTDPRAAQGGPGQAKAMAQMYAEFAKLGGVPYETQMDVRIQGEGPMAGLLSSMGSLSTATTTDSIETDALADDLFLPPADYRLNQK